jgi:hypothetical protein
VPAAIDLTKTLDDEGPQTLFRNVRIDPTKTAKSVVDRRKGSSDRRNALMEIVDLPPGHERIEIHPDEGDRHGRRRLSRRHEACRRQRACRVSEDGVPPRCEVRNDLSKVLGVVLRVVGGRRDMLAIAMAA